MLPFRPHQLPRTTNPSQSRPVEEWINDIYLGSYEQGNDPAVDCMCLPIRLAPESRIRRFRKDESGTAFLMRRNVDGFVLTSVMIVYAFPSISHKDMGREHEYINALADHHGQATMYEIGFLWVAPEMAVLLAQDYDMQNIVAAIISPLTCWRIMPHQTFSVIIFWDEEENLRAYIPDPQSMNGDDPGYIEATNLSEVFPTCKQTLSSASQQERNLGTTLFGYQNASAGADDRANIGADDFFTDDHHMKRVQSFFSTIRRPHQRRVKIAVLDTGLDINHPLLQKFVRSKQIGEELGRDFTMHPLGEPDLKDNTGHGTACTHLLLKTCPTAVVYTAKISNQSTFDEKTAERISEAIQTAITEWEVDIISMSLSYEYEVEIIDEALKNRQGDKKRPVLFFAASGNFGKDKDEPSAGFPPP